MFSSASDAGAVAWGTLSLITVNIIPIWACFNTGCIEKIAVIGTAKTLVFSGSRAVEAFLMTGLAGLSFLNVVLSVRAVSR